MGRLRRRLAWYINPTYAVAFRPMLTSTSPVNRTDSSLIDLLECATRVATQDPTLFERQTWEQGQVDVKSLPVRELRIYLDRILVGEHADLGLEALQIAGVLAGWLPEVQAMVGFGDEDVKHKDVWKHTKQVVMQAPARLAVRWGALLHDIGKPLTRTIEPGGQVHFFGHSEVGASMFRKRVGDRLAFTGELRERIHFLILHHLRASQFDGSWTDSAVRRFYKEMGDGLSDLLDLSRADITTKNAERRKRGIRQIDELSERIGALRSEDAIIPPLPKGLGTAIIEKFNLPPSKLVGDIRTLVKEDVDAGKIEAYRDSEYYIAWIESQRARFGL